MANSPTRYLTPSTIAFPNAIRGSNDNVSGLLDSKARADVPQIGGLYKITSRDHFVLEILPLKYCLIRRESGRISRTSGDRNVVFLEHRILLQSARFLGPRETSL